MGRNKQKYVTVEVSNIITQIAMPTDVPGYTAAVLEIFLPDENSLTDAEADKWIDQNNKRMTAICKFLNDNNL